MRDGTRNALVGVMVVGLAGVVAVWFFSNYKRVEREVEAPPSGEAGSNPYLALERLFEHYDVDTKTVAQMPKPDDDLTVALYVDRSLAMPPGQLEAWTSWVRAGGHLILPEPSETFHEVPDDLLEAVGFHFASSPEYAEDLETHNFDFEDDATTITNWGLSWTAEDLDWRATIDDDPTVAASRRMGDGRVTAVTEMEFWTNENIGKAKHATLIWSIVELSPRSERKAAIIQFGHRRSWMAYVVGQAWPFFVGLAALVVLALWRAFRRFGPTLASRSEAMRSRAEHVRATGEFLWKNGAQTRMLESVREALLRRLERKRPRIREAGAEERRRLVAEELGIEPAGVDVLFDTDIEPSREAFRRRITAMERFRRQL